MRTRCWKQFGKPAMSHAPTNETINLQVGGMTCAACQIHVRKALEKTPGVSEAAVNLMSGEATVVFDPSRVAVDTLLEAVRDSGYDAELPPPDVAEQEAREQAQIAEARSLMRKAIVSLALGAGAMWLSMQFMHDNWAHWVLLIVTLFVMTWAGGRVYTGAWSGARHRSVDMNTLVALGTGAAFVYSTAVTVAPGFFAVGSSTMASSVARRRLTSSRSRAASSKFRSCAAARMRDSRSASTASKLWPMAIWSSPTPASPPSVETSTWSRS